MKLLKRQGGLWLLLFFCWAPLASAQPQFEKVVSVVVTNIGPKVASDDLIRANIHIKPGDTYIRSSIDQDVLNLYDTGFFSNIRVTPTQTEQGVILTYILQGKLQLTGLTVEGNTKFSTAKLLKKAASKIGDPLDEQKLFNDSQEMQKMYEKAGYQHTIVKYVLGNLDYEAGKASVTFQVQETPKIKIAEVVFTGAQAFTQDKLRGEIKTKRHWMFSWITSSGIYKEDQFQEDRDKLADFYHNAGYIDFEIRDVRFTNPTPGTMRIEFIIFEGHPYKVGSVTFQGNKLFTTPEIVAGIRRAHFDSRSKTPIGEHGLEADVGMTFKPGALEHDVKAVSDFFGARGYISVREGGGLRVARIPNTETGTMDLRYSIDEGEKTYIEKIIIKGNVKTKDKVIRRELAVSPGDVFNMVMVDRSKQRLIGLDFFEAGKVDTKPAATDVPYHDDLIVGLEEKSTGNFTFGAGFNTVESVFGYAQLEQRNFDLFNPPYFTGGGQKFRLRVQIGTEQQDYEASFVEPWFLNRKLQLGVDLYRRVEDFVSLDNFYNESRTGVKVSLTRALGSDFLIGGISYNLEQVGIIDVNANSPDTILNEAGYALENRFGATLTYDTRNSYELPNSGQYTQAGVTMSVGDRNYYRTELKTSWFFPGLFPTHTWELSAKGGVTQSTDSRVVPFYDRFYLGGLDSLRGFDYRGVGPREPAQDGTVENLFEPIGGETYWFASAEYTIPIIDHLSFALFYDIGNVSQYAFHNAPFNVIGRNVTDTQPNVFLGPNFPGGTGAFSDDFGFGIRLNIPTLGPLRLDYGIPLTHDIFNGSGGKFQFGAGFSRPL